MAQLPCLDHIILGQVWVRGKGRQLNGAPPPTQSRGKENGWQAIAQSSYC
jgi:hypothetical protein